MFVSRFCAAVSKRWLVTGSLWRRERDRAALKAVAAARYPPLSVPDAREHQTQVSAGASCADRAATMVRKVDYSGWPSLTNENAG